MEKKKNLNNLFGLWFIRFVFLLLASALFSFTLWLVLLNKLIPVDFSCSLRVPPTHTFTCKMGWKQLTFGGLPAGPVFNSLLTFSDSLNLLPRYFPFEGKPIISKPEEIIPSTGTKTYLLSVNLLDVTSCPHNVKYSVKF